MYFIEYDTNLKIVSCINYKKKDSNLIEISEEQYIKFIEGIDSYSNYFISKDAKLCSKIKIQIINESNVEKLLDFCAKCKVLGYYNNSSIEKMKLEWCKQNGEYFCAIKDNEIIAVAGCHRLPQISNSAWRILFRGCELPNKDNFKGLSKGDWKSITQREFIPIMIDYCNSNELYLTTNVDIDNSNGKAARNHKLMGLLEKQGILSNKGDMDLFSTYQTLWQLNISEYQKRRNLIKNEYMG